MKTLTLALMVCALGCGNPKHDWSKKQLKDATVTLDDITFSVKVPDGLPKDKELPGVWDDERAEYDFVPKVFTSVETDEFQTVQDAMRTVEMGTLDESKFVRKKALASGWALTFVEGKDYIEAMTLTHVGDRWIKCSAAQRTDGVWSNFDGTKAMLESICDSVTPKS
jgi:hypothetical protein